MTYVYVYLALGLATSTWVVILYFSGVLKPSPEKTMEYIVGKALPSAHASKLVESVLLPASIGLTALIIWPLALFLSVQEVRAQRQKRELDALLNLDRDPELVITKQDLVRQMSQTEIETHELVDDPLMGAPKLPFGHMNGLWRDFVSTASPQSTFWAYDARRETPWETIELARGYVAVDHDSTISKPFRAWEKMEYDGTKSLM